MDAEHEVRPIDLGMVTTRSRRDLQARHAAVIAAAEEWGLRRSHPEWRFVSALIDAQASLADLLVGFADELKTITAEHRQAAKDELDRQHLARDETKYQLTQARGVVRDLDVEKARMADEMLKSAIPKLVSGVKDAVAVREVWVSRGRAIQHALIVATAAVALVAGGYAWRMVQVWILSDAALRNYEGIEICKQTSHYIDGSGHRLCRLDAFTASEADAK